MASPTISACSISATNPKIKITYKMLYPYVGEVLDKVGRRTGWTYGTVAQTCVNIKRQNPDLTLDEMRCQDVVDGGAYRGDSGSPVFYYHSSTGTGTAVGILWGGDGTATNFYMSSISGIEADFANTVDLVWRPALSVTMSGFFDDLAPYQTCRWEAQGAGGSGLYSYKWFKNGNQVSTNKSYSTNIGTVGFTLKVEVNDSWGGYANSTRTVDVSLLYGQLCR